VPPLSEVAGLRIGVVPPLLNCFRRLCVQTTVRFVCSVFIINVTESKSTTQREYKVTVLSASGLGHMN
jgi:hypothetical protein